MQALQNNRISGELSHPEEGVYLLISARGRRQTPECVSAPCSLLFARKNHWAARQSWSRISSISVRTNKLGAYLCTYSAQGENQRAWKHQVREKKNSHWLHMLLNASASRSRCPRPTPPRHYGLTQQLCGLFLHDVPQVAARLSASSWFRASPELCLHLGSSLHHPDVLDLPTISSCASSSLLWASPRRWLRC